MKKSLLIFIAVLMYRGFSAVPDFNSITTITVGGKPFDMAPAVGFASPQVIDWDGDGKKDLLVGEFANGGGGKIRLYKNTGTNNSPQFSTFEYLKAGGQEINVSSSWCVGASNPQVEDITGDKINDLIFGDADGYVFLCTRNSDGTLNDMQKLEADGKVIQYAHSSPEIVDWNEDGLLDLVVTGWEDSIYVYLNNGTAQQYTFTDRTIVKANGVPIRHPRNQVCIADLNNDGKKDIIIGTNDDKMGGAQLVFYENSGTNAAPLFTKGVALKSNNAVIANTYPNPILAFEVRLCVTDWNEDGTPDMVVGDNSANTIQIPLRYAGVFLGKSLTGNKISAVSKNDFFIKFTRFSSAGALEINCSRAGIFSIKLYAVNGKRIIYGNYYIEKGTSYIRLEGNAPCNETYLVEITGKNQKSIKQKIILSH